MLRNRALIRSAALLGIAAAASLSLATSASAESGPVAAVALVGRNAPQVETGAVLDGAVAGTAVGFTVIPEVERTDGSARSSYAFTDAAGIPVAPPVEASSVTIDPELAVSFLPAAEIPPAAPSNLSTVVLAVGFALLLFGAVATLAGSAHRLLPRARRLTAVRTESNGVVACS